MTTNVIPTTAIQHIALSKLGPSKANARRVNATARVSELADSIEAHGLIQNLNVRKTAKGGKAAKDTRPVLTQEQGTPQLSAEQIVAALLDVSSTRLTREELDRMSKMIDEAKKEGK